MTPDEHRRLTDALLPAVLAAGRLELDYFDAGCAVEHKLDKSPVTRADTEAEAILLASLATLFPALAIVSEEAFAAGHSPALTDTFLLVDPLDGTKQFVAGAREFTINIALVSRGRPIYGLIYAPALSDLMATDGARRVVRAHLDVRSTGVRNDDGVSLQAFSPVPTRVRTQSAIASSGGVIALQSRSRNRDISNQYLTRFQVAEQRWLGSSYKFCLIAGGEADIYPQLGPTHEWDTAAGEAILIAAGGSVATMDGRLLEYGQSASRYLNPPFVASSAPVAVLALTSLA